MNPYSDLSKQLTSSIPTQEKKAQGIYFTPPNDVQKIITSLGDYLPTIKTVLEPSCGSGEFLKALQPHKNFDITGIELNPTIYQAIRGTFQNMTILNSDFLTYNPERTYDLIIGNPPYFVMKKQEVNERFHDYFDGRPNIFILFIIHSLSMLSENGILCFVLPKCFLSSYYYDKTRRYINRDFTILNIQECCEKYIETQQETVVITVQNSKNDNNLFTFEKGKYLIFGTKDNITEIERLYDNSVSLSELGFKASVGNVVWNQCKDILTDDQSRTRLIYGTDIVDGKLTHKHYKNPEKKNYIEKEGSTQPVLVINRGYGKGKYKFNYCLIDTDKEFLIENHLICIKYQGDIERSRLMGLYQKIIHSFENIKTEEFIKMYFCNSAINTTELNHNLPIYL